MPKVLDSCLLPSHVPAPKGIEWVQGCRLTLSDGTPMILWEKREQNDPRLASLVAVGMPFDPREICTIIATMILAHDKYAEGIAIQTYRLLDKIVKHDPSFHVDLVNLRIALVGAGYTLED